MQQEESATATPITIFYSYAPEDKSYLEGLQRHLKTLHYPGDIFHVDNRQVPAGADRKQAIKDYLDKASIILFLVSSHFTGSDCLLEDEVEPALSRFEAGTAHVIPILLRPVNIEGTPFKDFQCLPRDDKPVSKWPDKEQAFLSIQKDMQVVINKLNNSRQNLVDKDQGHNSREVKNSERVATNSQERSQTEHVQRLLGLAIDLSGSMAKNIKNDTGGQITRLESLRQSLEKFSKSMQEVSQEEKDLTKVFAYGFGLRSTIVQVCDLLSLLTAVRDMHDEIEQRIQNYTDEWKKKFSGLEDLNDLAEKYGLGKLAQRLRQAGETHAKAGISRKVFHYVKEQLEPKLSTMEDSSMLIDDLATLLGAEGEVFTNAEELIYGDTPMCEALRKIVERYRKELQELSRDTVSALFILSDGEPTDCDDIQPMIEELNEIGVTIVSCFVTDKDLIAPRTLVGNIDSLEEKGAQLMFSMASPLRRGSAIEDYLEKRNKELEKHQEKEKQWNIAPGAKLFVQLNHSKHLEEFIDATLSFLKDRDEATQAYLPHGK